MNDWPVGLSTGSFFQKNILECLEPIQRSGFSIIEVCSFPAHLDYHDLDAVRRAAKRIEDLGMEAYSFHAPFADHIDISALDANRRATAQAELLRAAEAAATLGVWYLVVHPGPEHSLHQIACEERFQRMQNAAEVLDQVAFRCAELGIACVLENKLPHLVFGGTSDILWILGRMKATNVGTCLDTGHAFLSGDICHVTQKLSGHLKMIHANDNSGQFDDHRPPGEGKIDWHELLSELSAARFPGTFILELSGNADFEAILSQAKRSRRFLRRIARQLGLQNFSCLREGRS